jgi:hypothetical protein
MEYPFPMVVVVAGERLSKALYRLGGDAIPMPKRHLPILVSFAGAMSE